MSDYEDAKAADKALAEYKAEGGTTLTDLKVELKMDDLNQALDKLSKSNLRAHLEEVDGGEAHQILPRIWHHIQEILTVVDNAAALQEAINRSEENERLRAALANSELPCVYCTLSKEDWHKCQEGFPGCARADDAVGCPHLGAELNHQELINRLKNPDKELVNAVVKQIGGKGIASPIRMRNVYGYVVPICQALATKLKETPSGQ